MKHNDISSNAQAYPWLKAIMRAASRLARQTRRRRTRTNAGANGLEAMEPRVLLSGSVGGDLAILSSHSEPQVAALVADPVIDRSGVRGSDRLTLRRNGDRIELIDKRGNLLVDEALGDLQSLNIIGRDGKTDQLTVDFAFGGSFDIANGVTYDAGEGRGKDKLLFLGDNEGNEITLNGQNLTVDGVALTLVDVERLDIRAGRGNDDITLTGAPDFQRADLRDSGGDDTYQITLAGGRLKVLDKAGNDTYAFNPTGGDFSLKDKGRDFDTLDFSGAAGGVNLIAKSKLQDLGLGDSRVGLGGSFETIIGSAFADNISANGRGQIILGLGGDDVLDAGGGKDILIGGAGLDQLLGGGGEDVLIGGTTVFDGDREALQELHARWNARGRFDSRLDNVKFPGDVDDDLYLVSGTTVLDDGEADVIDGGGSRDGAFPAGDDEITNVENLDAPILIDFATAAFNDSLDIDNGYFPLIVGAQYIYEGEKEENGDVETERIVTDVLDDTREILGVTTRTVRDRSFVNGVLVEDTLDYYAQDDNGNVWYFGEEVTNFEFDEDGNVVGTNDHGSWIAGENNSLPGIQMFANPTPGVIYYQEFASLDEAIDQATVLALDGEVSIDLGEFTDVHVSREFTSLEPDALENKNYAPGIGLVLIEEELNEEGEPEFVIELVSFSLTAPPLLADFAAAAFTNSLGIANEYYPLNVGDQYVYEGEKDEDGEVETERVIIDVLADTREILGVTTRAVRDQSFVNDVVVEDTIDYYAQDDNGNVWYFGEEVINFEYDDEGNLLGTNDDGSWIAGENSAFPGIQMFANPVLNTNYYQEFAPVDEAIDQAIIFELDTELSIDFGDFTDVLVTREFTAIEPDVRENKHYAPGIGFVLAEEDLDEEGEPGFELALVEYTPAVP